MGKNAAGSEGLSWIAGFGQLAAFWRFAAFALLFLGSDFDLFLLDIQAQVVVDAYVLVGYPNQSKKCNQIAAPIRVQQLEASDQQKKDCHIMAEAVFASKQIEKFAPEQAARDAGLVVAIFPGFAKYFFVGASPG